MRKSLHPVLQSKWFPALSLIGAAISLFQTEHFYQFRAGLAGLRAVCDIGSSFSCSTIDASRYSELFAGIPLSAAASGWFLAQVVLWFWMKLDPQKNRNATAHYLFLFTAAIGSAFSVIYLAIMLFVLKTYCLFCFGVDAVNFLLLFFCLQDRTHFQPRLSMADSIRKITEPLKPFAAVFLATVVITFFLWRPKALPASDVQDLANSILQTPPVEVSIPAHSPTIGPADAPITVVKFSDLQCPACRYGAQAFHPIQKKYPGKVRFVFRNYPLDSSCNRHAQSAMHAKACQAAQVIQCANRNGDFLAAYEGIFQAQEALAHKQPVELALDAGADKFHLEKCLSENIVQNEILQDIEDGNTLGIRSTPTFFINGHRIEGGVQTAVWDELVQRILKK